MNVSLQEALDQKQKLVSLLDAEKERNASLLKRSTFVLIPPLFTTPSLTSFTCRIEDQELEISSKTSLVEQKQNALAQQQQEHESLLSQLDSGIPALKEELSSLKKEKDSIAEKLAASQVLLQEKILKIQQLEAKEEIDEDTIADLNEQIVALQNVWIPSLFSLFLSEYFLSLSTSNLRRRKWTPRERRWQ